MENEKQSSFIAGIWQVLKKAANRLQKNNPLLLAGATAFFATFALAPIFIIVVQLLGILVGKEEIKGNIMRKLTESAPDDSVDQLRRTISGLEQLSGAWYMNAGLILFLFFTSSTLFVIIRSSLYRLWRIKRVQEKSLGFTLRKRFFSVALMISAGVLLVLGLLGEGLQSSFASLIAELSPSAAGYFKSVYRHFISGMIAWVWFGVVFRFLTDARPQWKTVLAGGLFTAILFTLGKLLLQAILGGSNIPLVFGASASLVLLQLFVFYISLLIYYGAAFTIEWARYYKQTIHFPDYISFYTIEEKHTTDDKEHQS